MTVDYLVKRDGNARCQIRSEYCIMGENEFKEPIHATIDHKDGDKLNHRLKNLRLACQPCNSHWQKFQWKRKQAATYSHLRKKERKVGVLSETQKEKSSSEIKINIDNYPIFCRWLKDSIEVSHKISVKEAISAGAKYMRKKTGHGSPQSARNYLDMETSSEGSYDIIEGYVLKREMKQAKAQIVEAIKP